jgi:hypothetical protein
MSSSATAASSRDLSALRTKRLASLGSRRFALRLMCFEPPFAVVVDDER